MTYEDPFFLADRVFHSRLLLGTARYPSNVIMRQAIERSGAEIVTAAIRRITWQHQSSLKFLDPKLFVLPNTAGCRTAQEAVLTAELAREALGTPWIKLEVVGDETTLWPDITELLLAAEELVKKGFVVLPYCTDDLIVCQRLQDMGCAAVMPLGSPIGSGMGLCNPHNLALLRRHINVPIILDAGIGTASEVAIAMELGLDGVLVNTAVAQAQNPVRMAEAMNLACKSGRIAFKSGRIARRYQAEASSPNLGLITL